MENQLIYQGQMNVLSLVTNRYATFYKKQAAELMSQGLNIDHIYPRKQQKNHADQQNISRNHLDYLSILPKTWGRAFGEYDLVHANNGKTAPFALCQPHRPIVLTLWGSDLAGKYGKISKWCSQFCDEVIVRNEEMQRELGRDAHVIPAGIDMEQFSPSPQTEAQQAVGWDTSKKHVLFPYPPSRTVKNYPLAKRVVNRVDKECTKEVQLKTVYGVNHKDIPLYMNAVDALLLTSDREGSPNTVKEAMACNTPVISTDVGDVKERLSGVRNSEVCKSESGLVAALSKAILSEKRSNGREKVQELSLENMTEDIIDVYERALS